MFFLIPFTENNRRTHFITLKLTIDFKLINSYNLFLSIFIWEANGIFNFTPHEH